MRRTIQAAVGVGLGLVGLLAGCHGPYRPAAYRQEAPIEMMPAGVEGPILETGTPFPMAPGTVINPPTMPPAPVMPPASVLPPANGTPPLNPSPPTGPMPKTGPPTNTPTQYQPRNG